jgi:hypothetical protein
LEEGLEFRLEALEAGGGEVSVGEPVQFGGMELIAVEEVDFCFRDFGEERGLSEEGHTFQRLSR